MASAVILLILLHKDVDGNLLCVIKSGADTVVVVAVKVENLLLPLAGLSAGSKTAPLSSIHSKLEL